MARRLNTSICVTSQDRKEIKELADRIGMSMSALMVVSSKVYGKKLLERMKRDGLL